MRITSGTARGLTLLTPAGDDTRPTSDKVKQSLFNMLCAHFERSRLEDIKFLDLFAGSGAIGIEALSRGADSCVFVDNSREAVAAIKHNLERARLSDKAEVYCADVFKSLEALANKNRCFDVIFLDAPYSHYELADCAKAVTQAVKELSLLNSSSSFLIAETGYNADLSELACISPFKQKSYGKTSKLTFFVPN